MEIKKNTRNELLKRQELILELKDEKNPGFEKTKKQITEKFSKPEENIDVRKVQGGFGKKTFIIKANIYDSKQDLENIKKLEITKKQRKEQAEAMKKAQEEKAKEQTEEVKHETETKETQENKSEKEQLSTEKTNTMPVEERPEQTQEQPEQKPTEPPVEERPEEESKAVQEEKQAEQENKKN